MKPFVYIIFAALAMLSCNEMEEEISWKLDDYPDKLNVDGTIVNSPRHQTIMLTLTTDYFNTGQPPAVSGATVMVTSGSQVYTYSESNSRPGLYISDEAFTGEPTKTYVLDIHLETPVSGFSDYSATTLMPRGIELDTILCEVYEMPILDIQEDEEDVDSTILGIYYFGYEPVDEENYYLARIFSNEVPLQKTAKEILTFNDEFSNGNYNDFILYVDNVMPDDFIRFCIISVEKKFYDYINDLKMIDESGNAFSMSGPPANATGNIPNATGYFAAIFSSEKTGIAVDMR